MYFAGLGPVKDGTPMNLYCMSGGLGRRVERRGSFGAFTFLTLPVLPEGAALGSGELGCGVAPLALTGVAGTGFTAVGFEAAGFATATAMAFSGWALAATFAGGTALAPFVASFCHLGLRLGLENTLLGGNFGMGRACFALAKESAVLLLFGLLRRRGVTLRFLGARFALGMLLLFLGAVVSGRHGRDQLSLVVSGVGS